jgi:hypothetical protein
LLTPNFIHNKYKMTLCRWNRAADRRSFPFVAQKGCHFLFLWDCRWPQSSGADDHLIDHISLFCSSVSCNIGHCSVWLWGNSRIVAHIMIELAKCPDCLCDIRLLEWEIRCGSRAAEITVSFWLHLSFCPMLLCHALLDRLTLADGVEGAIIETNPPAGLPSKVM